MKDVPGILARHARGIEQLCDAKKMADARKCVPLGAGAIGLVVLPDGGCSFVLWTQISARKARPVRIDERWRIISMMHFAQPETDYSGAEIVIGNTGLVQPYHKRPHERPPVDPWLLLLQLERNTQTFQGPLLLDNNDPMQCVRCAVLGSVEEEVEVHGAAAGHAFGGPIQFYRCQVCLLLWHNACACRYRGGAADFSAFVCPVCTP